MFPVLSAPGPVGAQESALIVQATLLMSIVIVPVLALLFFFAWRYRAGGKAKYVPEWEHAKLDELIWWAVPVEIILVLAAITWTSTHALDPHKALAAPGRPVVVQVVALPWKWLFMYPGIGVSAVNELEVPSGVPLEFQITADAPMNSFWIPALGGQIYAMQGMVNPLNLIAPAGRYDGLSANYSGAGFADMRFEVKSVPPQEFEAWAQSLRAATTTLDWAAYRNLASPGTTSSMTFGSTSPALFNQIVGQYAGADGGHTH
jgi:cytochrome o ubiquinol oxidase subunit 2